MIEIVSYLSNTCILLVTQSATKIFLEMISIALMTSEPVPHGTRQDVYPENSPQF